MFDLYWYISPIDANLNKSSSQNREELKQIDFCMGWSITGLRLGDEVFGDGGNENVQKL